MTVELNSFPAFTDTLRLLSAPSVITMMPYAVWGISSRDLRAGAAVNTRVLKKDWRFIFEKWVLGRHRPPPYEPDVKKALVKIRGRLFVDIGANQGVYSLLLRRNFARVYAFEPNPLAMGLLRKNIQRKRARNIVPYPYALADFDGETKLFLDPHAGTTGSADTILERFEYKPGQVEGAGPDHLYLGRKAVSVQVRKYDDIIPREVANLVKVDVEGAEFLVLKGAELSLTEGRIRNIEVELHNRERKEELVKILESYGFETSLLDAHPRIFGSLTRAAN